eukprot:2447768-Ditylum_brightwellii.AAC.1
MESSSLQIMIDMKFTANDKMKEKGKHTNMPKSLKDMRHNYTQGKCSFLKNIPYPPVNVLDNFIHINLMEICSDLFGFGYDVDVIPSPIDFPEFYNLEIKTSVYQGSFGKSLGEELSCKCSGEKKDYVVHVGIMR